MEPNVAAQREPAPLVGEAVRRAGVRLVPFLGLLYLLNFVDRVNVGFAALTMNADLGLSAAAYGLGAGLFFIGYFLFEVPSNIILHRVGARLWIARIMVSWGVVASSTAFVQGPVSFYLVRVLLGLAEAGFFPGIILYLGYWFPRARRARIVSLFFLAVPLASVLGAPVSTLLIQHGDGALGFDHGWRFMFFVEGLPSVLFGLLVMLVLPSRPRDARWLSSDQREALATAIEREDTSTAGEPVGVRAALTNASAWALSLVYFGLVFGLYVMAFFLPQVIKGFERQFEARFSLTEVGLVTTVPYLFASVAMLLWGRHSDRTGERRWHVAVGAFVAAVAVSAALYMTSPLLVMLCVTVTAAGVFAVIPVFWSLSGGFLSGVGMAAAIGMINSFGNLAGFAGPYLVGWLQDATGSFLPGMWVVAGLLALAGFVVLVIPVSRAGRPGHDCRP